MSWHGYEPDCVCKKCVKYGKDLEKGGMAYADRQAQGGGGRRGRGNRVRNTALQAGAAALSVGGYMAEPGQPPNTEQLDDAYTSQTDGRRSQTINDATTGQGRNRNGSSRRRT